MKNLLKFIGIGLVLVMAVYSQGVSTDTPVEAAAAAIANNDIEFLENDSSNEGQVVKHYPATSAGGTNAQTHDVRFFINDSDLNKVQDGLTTIRGNNGNANVNTIQHESTIELDADDKGTIDASDAGSDDDPLGTMTDTDGYDSAGSPKTALVANTLAVKLGAAVKTFQIDAQDDVNGTFSLSADAIISDTVFLTATYKFNSVQTYSAVPTGTTGAGVDINTRRAKVTSTSDSGGEWVAIGEKSGISLTHANLAASTAIDSKYFGGTVKIGSDASYAASGDSTIWVQDGDTLTVTYYGAGTDSDGSGAIESDEIGSVVASTTATIDDSAPSIGNVSPEDGTLTKDTSPDLSFTMTDTGSGFGSSVTTFGSYVAVFINGCIVTDAELGVSSFAKDSITVTYTAPVGTAYSADATAGGPDINCTTLTTGQSNTEAEDRTGGGFEINTTSANADATLKRTTDGNAFPISIVATDAAGNSKTLGARTGGGSTDLDVLVDSVAPAATGVTGAKAWSSADKKDVDDNSSIKIVFDESIDIDSVTASDFSISGTGVTSTEIVSITSGGGTAAAPALAGTAVYLDLGADLGPNAKPKVKLVSSVSDLAGNEYKPTSSQMTNNGGITLGTAADGVKPTLSGMAIGDNLLDSKETTSISLTSNENLTKTNETLANGCTCGSVTGSIDATVDLKAANNATDPGGVGLDTEKLSVTLSTPTTGSASIKEINAPFSDPTGTPSAGIFGITMVGKDAGNNKGIGGIVKVTDEDISKYFTAAGALAGDGALNADGEELSFKVKNGPLADSDGDGELSDELIGMSVGGTAKTAVQIAGVHIEHIDLGEAETITLQVPTIATLGAIAADSTVKVTYYYVADANVVEVDKDAPTATFSPADGATTTDTTPSISVTWDDDEYGWDSFTTVTLTKAEMKDPDGTVLDISADMTSTDNKSFYYKPLTALALGEYKMTFKAKDATDNESSDKSFKFTVKARSKTEIAMSPGWNLVSIPGEPADNDINAVITNSQITTVLTYDPSTPGGWLTAVRDGDLLTGTLTTIDASHAYWVLSNNSDKIKVDIPGYTGGVAAVPPAINIVVGWNLIPAVSLSGAASWDIDLYLAGLTWVKAKSWNAASEAWIELDSITDNNATSMTSGKGYWLYATKAGTLVP